MGGEGSGVGWSAGQGGVDGSVYVYIVTPWMKLGMSVHLHACDPILSSWSYYLLLVPTPRA